MDVAAPLGIVGILAVITIVVLLLVADKKLRKPPSYHHPPEIVSEDSAHNHKRAVSRETIRGFLYVGENAAPKTVELKQSGGIPLCPICRMPMEKVRPIRFERPSDIFIWRESGEPTRWRCYHTYPVVFEPKE